MKLYRAYRGDGSSTPPEPGKDNGATHVGDYPTKDEAVQACRALARERMFGVDRTAGNLVPITPSFYIEPVRFNSDDHAPAYENAGAIKPVRL